MQGRHFSLHENSSLTSSYASQPTSLQQTLLLLTDFDKSNSLGCFSLSLLMDHAPWLRIYVHQKFDRPLFQTIVTWTFCHLSTRNPIVLAKIFLVPCQQLTSMSIFKRFSIQNFLLYYNLRYNLNYYIIAIHLFSFLLTLFHNSNKTEHNRIPYHLQICDDEPIYLHICSIVILRCISFSPPMSKKPSWPGRLFKKWRRIFS